ncbi:MFS transporter [Paenibacillus sp. y28]|uniref:MFS transporter n=1 Tax=Paenibacillus sp. y28 TaxID=3129110 RepID=UPI003019CFE6
MSGLNPYRSALLLRCFTFAFFMTGALVTAYFPLYFDARGYSKIQIGILYSVGPLIGIFSNILWGLLSDKFQTIKRLMHVLLAGQLIMVTIMLNLDLFAALFITITCFFFFQTPMSALGDSLALLAASQTGKSYASFRIWGSLGFAVAAVGFGMLLQRIGQDWTLYMALGTIFISLLLSFIVSDRPGGKGKVQFNGLLDILRSRRLLAFFLLVFIISVAHRINDSYLSLFLLKLGAPETIVGWTWTMSAISEIPMFFLLARYGHHFRELPLLVIASLMYFIRFVLMAITTDPLLIVAIQGMHSLSFGIYFVTALRFLQQLIPDEYRSSGQAMFTVVWSGCAGITAGTTGGWIFDSLGPEAVYWWAAILSFLASLGFLLFHFRNGH